MNPSDAGAGSGTTLPHAGAAPGAVTVVPARATPTAFIPRRWRAAPSGRNWFAVCALGMIVASDYKVRVRPPTSTLSGGFDIFIVLEILIYGLVGAYLLLTLPSLPRLRRMPAVIFLACAYVTLLVISLLHAPYQPLAAVRATQEVIVLMLALAAWGRATRADLHRFAHAFVVLVAGSVILGVLVPMPRYHLQEGRFTWLRIHPVTAGVFLALATVLALTYVLTCRTIRPGPIWPRWVYIVLLLLVGGGLAATLTRGAVAGGLIGCLVVLALTYRGRQRLRLALVMLIALILLVIAGSSSIVAYFARGEDASQLATLNSRTALWSLAWNAVQQHPFVGWGIGASRGIFLDEIGLGGGHNALVNVAVDLGAVGLVVWGSFIFCLVVTMWRVPQLGPQGIGIDRALIVGAFAALLVDSVFFEGLGAVTNIAGTWLMVTVGWVSVLVRRSGDTPSFTPRSLLPWRNHP